MSLAAIAFDDVKAQANRCAGDAAESFAGPAAVLVWWLGDAGKLVIIASANSEGMSQGLIGAWGRAFIARMKL